MKSIREFKWVIIIFVLSFILQSIIYHGAFEVSFNGAVIIFMATACAPALVVAVYKIVLLVDDRNYHKGDAAMWEDQYKKEHRVLLKIWNRYKEDDRETKTCYPEECDIDYQNGTNYRQCKKCGEFVGIG